MSTPSRTGNAAAYVCDTLPPPRLASSTSKSCSRSPSPISPASPPPVTTFDPPIINTSSSPSEMASATATSTPVRDAKEEDGLQVPQPPARKLCVRHQRMADEGTNLKLQQALDALPVAEREAVSVIWSNFSSSPHPRRALILQGLLTMCCFSQLSLLTEQLAHLIRIDPFTVLPREVSLKILGYLDATSLCRAAQVSRQWKSLADDDILWRGICEQHIGQKCLKCGWGLPILEKRRAVRIQPSAHPSPCPSPASFPSSASHSHLKRRLDADAASATGPSKKARVVASQDDSRPPTPSTSQLESLSAPLPEVVSTVPNNPLLAPSLPEPPVDLRTRPWKDVYCERLTIERNWRRGRCSVRTLKGHTDGVMCLQFSETLSHPSFPVLITGSYDRTARVWNLETGTEVQCLSGHTRAIRALQFDEVKLITGSMDHTMRVWNWRTGQCLKVLEGHTEGVVCLRFDSNILASGSVDRTIKVWNFRTGECFTLRGHCDWVNAVQIWDSTGASPSRESSLNTVDNMPSYSGSSTSAPHIDPGKMLFSASDDGTIRLWDLSLRTCVRQFKGHVGQVQSLKLFMEDEECDSSAAASEVSDRETSTEPHDIPRLTAWSSSSSTPTLSSSSRGSSPVLLRQNTKERTSTGSKRQKPVLISGSLDNTIKIWDIETAKVQRTLFGHIEGVWAVASDKLRLVSGSHDRTIKVWSREEGNCTATLVGHRGAVTCLALGEDKIVSGSDDHDIRVWSFA